jgi:hypothetical protein
MKKTWLALLLVGLAGFVPGLAAQDKAKQEETDKAKREEVEKAAETRKEITPLRILVLFTEFDGEKKISSLPYTFLVNADERGGPGAILRMGLRVPVVMGSRPGADAPMQWQYVDMGTNLDGRAEKSPDGRFVLHLGVERSSAYSPGSDGKPASVAGREVTNAQPVIQQFRTNINLLIRDGQTIQSTVSTDPVTGHVLKVDVTLTVLK